MSARTTLADASAAVATEGTVDNVRRYVLADLVAGPNDYARLIAQPPLRHVSGLTVRKALDALVADGSVTVGGAFETYRLVAS